MATDWYPKALIKPIQGKYRNRPSGAYPNALILHVAVSESPSLHGFFSRTGTSCSHFYLRKDGTFEQYLPISSKSAADLDANYRSVSVETQGGVHNPQTEPWTEEQVTALSELSAWLYLEFGIPLNLMGSSHASATGVGWHRLGINGNFPAMPDILAGRAQRGGGETFSNAYGKVCPGNAKITQIPTLVDMARALVGAAPGGSGGSTTVGNPYVPQPPTGKITLSVDGVWGPQTTRRLQQFLGTPMDGVISSQYPRKETAAMVGVEWSRTPSGSTVIRALQNYLKGKGYTLVADGLMGPNTIRAMQHRLGTFADGTISSPKSQMVMALQRSLNANKL